MNDFVDRVALENYLRLVATEYYKKSFAKVYGVWSAISFIGCLITGGMEDTGSMLIILLSLAGSVFLQYHLGKFFLKHKAFAKSFTLMKS